MKRTLWGAFLLAAASAGCSDSFPSEVVVVVQSDLSVPTDADALQFSLIAGSFAPNPNGAGSLTVAAFLTGDFPVSQAVTADRMTTAFSMTVQLLHGLANGTQAPTIVVSRTVTDIRFGPQQSMMLQLPLLRRCACQGTTCPLPGDPECDNIVQPPLQPLDPAVAPSSSFLNPPTIALPPPETGAH
jgi:hypothetical protein